MNGIWGFLSTYQEDRGRFGLDLEPFILRRKNHTLKFVNVLPPSKLERIPSAKMILEFRDLNGTYGRKTSYPQGPN
jgi:hypothetical protein